MILRRDGLMTSVNILRLYLPNYCKIKDDIITLIKIITLNAIFILKLKIHLNKVHIIITTASCHHCASQHQQHGTHYNTQFLFHNFHIILLFYFRQFNHILVAGTDSDWVATRIKESLRLTCKTFLAVLNDNTPIGSVNLLTCEVVDGTVGIRSLYSIDGSLVATSSS